MKKISLFLLSFITAGQISLAQTDLSSFNEPIELLNQANEDIENGNYEHAVQKLIASIRLNPKIREAYQSLIHQSKFNPEVLSPESKDHIPGRRRVLLLPGKYLSARK